MNADEVLTDIRANEIDYKIEPPERWKVLLPRLYELPIDERRRLLKDAVQYRSPQGMMGVYMGGIALVGLCNVFRIKYMKDSIIEAIGCANEETLNAGIKHAIHTIEYMLANPVKACPHCGQIMSDK